MALTQQQQDALDHVLAVTASATDGSRQRDEQLLRENGWNVQATIEQIFNLADQPDSTLSSAGPSRPTNRSTSAAPDQPHAPQSSRRLSGTPTRPRAPGTSGVGLGIWDKVFVPFTFLFSLLTGAWYFMIRTFLPLSFLPHLPYFLRPPSPTQRIPRPAQDPTATSLAFVRDLETLTSASTSLGTLPELYIGPYREFLTHVRKEAVVGMVVLVSSEHEDDEEFKRGTLADKDVVKVLRDENVAVWAADISSREGFQVSQTLLTTSYPSIIFLSLTPSPSSPKLQILSTLAGPPSSTTSPTSILHTLTTSILPRSKPYLNRLKAEKFSLAEARHLRAAQDKALREAEGRDRERMRVEKQKAEAERLRAEREEREKAEKAEFVQGRQAWRRYARKHLLEPSSGPIRVALRTPFTSERHVRQFTPSSSTLPLFTFASTLLIPASHTTQDDPDSFPSSPASIDPTFEGHEKGEEGEEGDWEFNLITSYPRHVIKPVRAGGEEVWELIKKSGGVLFLEKKDGREWNVEKMGDEEEEDEEIVSDDE
ncbi:hypothetical protein B9479_003132 [Cryptococcus floricola]|uniref:UAS domain-containing protein n=1 Tax=Cryptococcus floricola TaxID=2591691 RepID=A0A5D3B1U2_9TREE|nr:hypothetical protein B9479_003132 [Cryptococcus floricola]